MSRGGVTEVGLITYGSPYSKVKATPTSLRSGMGTRGHDHIVVGAHLPAWPCFICRTAAATGGGGGGGGGEGDEDVMG